MTPEVLHELEMAPALGYRVVERPGFVDRGEILVQGRPERLVIVNSFEHLRWRMTLARMRERARRMYDQRMRTIVGDEGLVRELGLGFYPGAGW